MQRGKESVLIMETIGDIIEQQRPQSTESFSTEGNHDDVVDSPSTSTTITHASITRLERAGGGGHIHHNNHNNNNITIHDQHEVELHTIKKEHGVGVEVAVVAIGDDLSNDGAEIQTISNHITVTTSNSNNEKNSSLSSSSSTSSSSSLSHQHHQQHHQSHHHPHHQQSHHHTNGDERNGGDVLSVIVQSQDSSHDSSQLLSPTKLSPTSVSIMDVDASEYACRTLHVQPEPTYQTLTSVNGRMSPPGFSPNSSYATLTPLQPLPPISTMSDKFAYGGHTGHTTNGSNTFAIMQNNGGITVNLGGGINSPYNYDKLSSHMNLSPNNSYSPNTTLRTITHHTDSPISPSPSTYSQNGLSSPQKSLSPDTVNNYDTSPAYGNNGQRDIVTIARTTLQSTNHIQHQQQHSPNLSPPSTSLHSPGGNTILSSFGGNVTQNSTSLATLNDLTIAPSHHHHHSSSLSSPLSLSTNQHQGGGGLVQISHISHVERDTIVTSSPSPPLLTIQHTIGSSGSSQNVINTICNNNNNSNNGGVLHQTTLLTTKPQSQGGGGLITTATGANTLNVNVGGGGGGDIEEINTKDLAQRISAELKRYSIPQAIFAQRVLCRSQGTLSDLLRNPKPWSKLKSGRETFRRMWKWLQEPEFQRMSALRLAAAQIPQRGSCKRKEELVTQSEHIPTPKKPRLVFTDLQRRTLQAIFKETKRPSKEMQVTIARQLGLEPTTVGNFFMNARRRSMDKWKDEDPKTMNQQMAQYSPSSSGVEHDDPDQDMDHDMDGDMDQDLDQESEHRVL
ncbi:homeobox protein onecut [Chrysoperla carnea]|uniref:homeobox protein onecut n=1 Tax=Chrysoperla carnea TaxID=189513 RepID=UPI001D08824A|nr:homeobox protein onecut [Chrysoperla carnea]